VDKYWDIVIDSLLMEMMLMIVVTMIPAWSRQVNSLRPLSTVTDYMTLAHMSLVEAMAI
jgi:hypothetical protein